MIIEQLLKNKGEWLSAKGDKSNVIISSRIRIARNLNDFKFTNKADEIELNIIKEKILNALLGISYTKDSYVFQINDMEERDKEILLEKHLISKNIINNPGSAVVIDKNQILSVMINEEDHIRATAFLSGLSLMDSWRILTKLDDEMSKNLEFAYSSRYGYLTACPTNAGTGLRASVLAHLPALVMSDKIKNILKILNQMNISVRGYYGEGSNHFGNFFQMSNQQTLGLSEEEIITGVESTIKRVVNTEYESREDLMSKNKNYLEDKIYRAYGILQNARTISSKEAMDLLSFTRLGSDLGLIKNVDNSQINNMLLYIQPGHLQHYVKKNLTSKERDIARADYIRNHINA